MFNIAVKLGAVGAGILGLIGATVYLIEQGHVFWPVLFLLVVAVVLFVAVWRIAGG